MRESGTAGIAVRPDAVAGRSAVRVLYLMYDLERGGPEMRLLDLARSFPPDVRLTVYSTSTRVALRPDFDTIGVDVRVTPIGAPYREWGTLRRLRAQLAADEAHVVNLFDLKALLVTILPRRLRGRERRPALVYHSVNATSDLSRWQEAALIRAVNRCDAVVCNSIFSRDLLVRAGVRPRRSIEVIYNGVDAAAFARDAAARARVRAGYGFREDDIVLGMVGNFRPQKDYPFLFEAYRELRTRVPRLRLLCVGGGPLLDSSRELLARMGLSEEVILSGYTSDVAGHLAAMDVFALCSKWEGLPNVILQAMCAGLPVVASEVGGCGELVQHGVDGLLYPAGDRRAFVDAVLRLTDPASSQAAELANAGLTKAATRFTLQAMADCYAEYYRQFAQGVA